MSKKRILTYCIDGLQKPQLYKSLGYAQKRCLSRPSFKLIWCQDADQAERLYKSKLEEFEQSTRRKRVQILKKNLDVGKQEDNKDNTMIVESQRMERERLVNEIFCQHHFSSVPTFKSFSFSVDPNAVYEGFFDGACKGNPGQGSIGAYLRFKNTTIMSISQKLGKVTNNQAELISLGHLLAHSFCNGIGYIKVFGDSKLAIDFMNKRCYANEPILKKLVYGNQILSSKFSKVIFGYVPREENKEADRLANAVFKKSLVKAE